ncbi:MAG TPA: protein kinase [Gemmatimonadales bacterium]|nr:protein kinase [Gemmatimonadales bacterium]
MSDLQDRLAAVLGPHYRLERELGGGGMSQVFLAVETALDRKVVLKVLPPDFGAALSPDRFRREIQLAASLNHPHIVPLLAAGEADGLLYYTMPYIEGESLRAKLARDGELPVAATLRILKEVVDALEYAHEHGVVHRDIKPDNILLTKHHAVVTDFGVAKALSASSGTGSMLTSTGLALGTPAYMAPEQATADPHVDHRADIYAVGAMAYEMLSGQPPFVAATPQAVLAAQVTRTPEALTSRRPACPPLLGSLVMRCLEKRPADRWQSAEELLGQIDTAATSAYSVTTPAAPPVTAAMSEVRPGRTPAWRRMLMAGLGAVGLVVLGVLGSRLWQRGGSAGPQRLVVLPFENLGAPEDEYFADGITEEITSRLATVPAILVTSRTTAKQYKGAKKTAREIGQELGVAYVLEGSVRWDKVPGASGPSRVRVTPQLIRVGDDSHLWADRYDAELADIFTVQSKMAQEVVAALGIALGQPQRQALAARPTENPQAYDHYLRALDHYDRTSEPGELQAGVRELEQAVALDSSFAVAWAELGTGHAQSYWTYLDHTPERLGRAKDAIDRALALQPDLPKGHVAKGWYLYWGFRDYDAALAELERARQALPNDGDLTQAIAYIHRRKGNWNEAIAGLKRAIELDPHSVDALVDLAKTQQMTGAYADAERSLNRAVALFPDALGPYNGRIVLHLQWRGDTAKAKQAYREARSRRGQDARRLLAQMIFLAAQDSALQSDAESVLVSSLNDDTLSYYYFKAEFYRLRGMKSAARAYTDSLVSLTETHVKRAPDDDVYHDWLGWGYATLGRKAEAIREARRAVELVPPSKDAYFGMENVINLASVYAAVGEPDLAVEQIEIVLAKPSTLSVSLLRVDPAWDPLRGNPRFQALLSRK